MMERKDYTFPEWDALLIQVDQDHEPWPPSDVLRALRRIHTDTSAAAERRGWWHGFGFGLVVAAVAALFAVLGP